MRLREIKNVCYIKWIVILALGLVDGDVAFSASPSYNEYLENCFAVVRVEHLDPMDPLDLDVRNAELFVLDSVDNLGGTINGCDWMNALTFEASIRLHQQPFRSAALEESGFWHMQYTERDLPEGDTDRWTVVGRADSRLYEVEHADRIAFDASPSNFSCRQLDAPPGATTQDSRFFATLQYLGDPLPGASLTHTIFSRTSNDEGLCQAVDAIIATTPSSGLRLTGEYTVIQSGPVFLLNRGGWHGVRCFRHEKETVALAFDNGLVLNSTKRHSEAVSRDLCN